MAAKTIKAWAVVARDKIVINESKTSLGEMLIFDKKWRAQSALWNKNEKVIAVSITLDKRGEGK